MRAFQHRSVSPITTHTLHPKSGVGRSLTYRVVFLEERLERTLEFGKGSRLRFVGELDGVPLQGAWQSAPGKGHYAMLSAATLNKAERDVGDEVTLRFDVVDPDVVIVPEDLADALTTFTRLKTAWEAYSQSERRAKVAFIESAKTDVTRAKRIAELVAALRGAR